METSMTPTQSLSPWRVEWLRVWRTRRLIGLLFVYLFFGFADPLLARYLGQIISSASNNDQIQVIVADPGPIDGIVGYVGSAMQIGLMVGLALLVSACAIDASYQLAVYYRTRRADLWTLLVPRLAVSLLTMTVGFALGMAAAWYETAVLIGMPSAAGILRVLIAGLCYQLAFAGVAFLLTAMLRSVGITTAIAIILVLLSSVLTSWPSIARWSPVGLTNYAETYAGTDGLAQPVVASLALAAITIAAGLVITQNRQLAR